MFSYLLVKYIKAGVTFASQNSYESRSIRSSSSIIRGHKSKEISEAHITLSDVYMLQIVL